MGQSVEIIRAEGQSPQASWLSLVKTGRARGAIKRSLREADNARFLRFGTELATITFNKHGRRLTQKALSRAAKQQGMRAGEDLLIAIGRGDLSAYDVVYTLFPDARTRTDKDMPASQELVGIDKNAPYTIAQCCQPLPGERIVGIAEPGKGYFIHAIDCDELMASEAETWVDLRWKEGQHPPCHIVSLEVVMGNSEGVLGRLCSLIGQQKVNIADVRSVTRRPDFYVFRFDLELRDNHALHSIITALESDEDVASVRRQKDIKTDQNRNSEFQALITSEEASL